jgi:uncharacterized protein
MARVLVFLFLAALIWLLLRGFFRRQAKGEAAPARSGAGEDMVSCARCGVNLPRSEAGMDDGRYVCRDNPRCIDKTR